MSWRTFIEVNHDLLSELERTPSVGAYLKHALGGDDRAKESLRHMGIHILGRRHHSDGASLSVNGHEQWSEPPSKRG